MLFRRAKILDLPDIMRIISDAVSRMLALLDRCGFEFTGLVHYPTGERRAFEKLI